MPVVSGASTDSGLERSRRDGEAGEEPTRMWQTVKTVPAAGGHVESKQEILGGATWPEPRPCGVAESWTPT